MPRYIVEMEEECGGSETRELHARTRRAVRPEAERETEDWVQDGDYGPEGASIRAWYTVRTASGAEILPRSGITVEIGPDHDTLIARAGGDPDCDHDWTSKGDGGCQENPGVWSTGGTSMSFASHCRRCGLRRLERATGPQRNPGDHDTTEYEQPTAWCSTCECEECDCTHCRRCGLRRLERAWCSICKCEGCDCEECDCAPPAAG